MWIALLFAGGIMAGLVQVAVLEAPWQHLYSDALGYIQRAKTMASPDEQLTAYDTFFPLGLSYIYSTFFYLLDESSALYWLAFLQILSIAACHVLVYLTGSLLFKNQAIARLASLMSLAYWPLTAQLSAYLAEPLFMLLLLGGQYLILTAILGNRIMPALIGGLLVGLAATIKTQGLIILIAAIMVVVMFRRGPRTLAPVLIGCLIPILLHSSHLGQLRNGQGLAMPANGAFNLYLGQSARAGLGIHDVESQRFVFFYNNNTYLNKGLLAPEILPTSLLDQGYFNQRTLDLIRENPLRQLLRTLQSGFELHTLAAHWPLRNTPGFARAERLFKFAAVLLLYLPALVTLSMSWRYPSIRLPVLALFLPLLGMTAVAGIAMGQPRYLLPFLPNLMLLGSVGLVAISNRIASSRKSAAP